MKSTELFSILRGHFEAVFLQQWHEIEVKLHQALFEHMLDMRFTDLVLAQVIEIDFVDGPAGRNNSDVHEHKHATKLGASTDASPAIMTL